MSRQRARVVASMLAIAAIPALGASLTAAPAQAKPAPAQMVWTGYTGNTAWVLGKNGNCRGPIRIDIQTDPHKRGAVFVTYRPGRFVGDGPGWKRNPQCRITLGAQQSFADNARGKTHRVQITAGPNGGKAVKQTLRPGSGLQWLAFPPVGVVGYPPAGFVLVP